MHIEWHVTQTDKERVRALVDKHRHIVLIRDRCKRNLASNKKQVTKERLWRTIVCMRLTTQARSGPKGRVAAFQQLKPFPLRYAAVRDQKFLAQFILKTLRANKVGRHPPAISKQLAANLHRLEQGEWDTALQQCNRLTKLVQRRVEAEVADYLDKILEGFGPKQSRNVLQALGLTRFEIPIDSRVPSWLNESFKFPFRVNATALGDRDYYGLVSDAICQLCEECGEFPCILDAAIFGSKDGDLWMMEQLRY
jgi:hypothetical protein